jgi:hypothetical protein
MMSGMLHGIRRTLVIAIIALVVIVGAGEFVAGAEIWCDGSYHRFQIPDDYNHTGCSRIIPLWHGVLPWNWDRTDMVCLGLCTDMPMLAPDR